MLRLGLPPLGGADPAGSAGGRGVAEVEQGGPGPLLGAAELARLTSRCQTRHQTLELLKLLLKVISDDYFAPQWSRKSAANKELAACVGQHVAAALTRHLLAESDLASSAVEVSALGNVSGDALEGALRLVSEVPNDGGAALMRLGSGVLAHLGQPARFPVRDGAGDNPAVKLFAVLRVGECAIKQLPVVRELVVALHTQALNAQRNPGKRDGVLFASAASPLLSLWLGLSPIQVSASVDAAIFTRQGSMELRQLAGRSPAELRIVLARLVGRGHASFEHFCSLDGYPRACPRALLVALVACGDQQRHARQVLAGAFKAVAMLGAPGSAERAHARDSLLGWVAATAAMMENVGGVLRKAEQRAAPDAFVLNLVSMKAVTWLRNYCNLRSSP